MISSRPQKRLLLARCAHSTLLRSSQPRRQIRFALSSSSSSTSHQHHHHPPQPPPKSGNTQAAAAAAAATRARIHAQKKAPPPPVLETPEEYRARYKSAARRWTASIIALPILFVTSYYLFDRLALGNAQKVLNRERKD